MLLLLRHLQLILLLWTYQNDGTPTTVTHAFTSTTARSIHSSFNMLNRNNNMKSILYWNINYNNHNNANVNSSRLYASPSSLEDETQAQAQAFLNQAKKMKLEAKKLELEMTLDKISKLECQLQKLKLSGSSGDGTDGDGCDERIGIIQEEIAILELKLDAIETGKIVALPVKKNQDKSCQKQNFSGSLNDKQLINAVNSFQNLPRYMRKRLANAVNLYDDDDLFSVEKDTFNATQVVIALYSNRSRLLADGAFDQSNKQKIQVEVVKKSSMGKPDETVNVNINSTDELLEYLTQMESELETDEARRERFVTSIFPDATRKESAVEPTEEDAQLFLKTVLSSKTYSPTSKPEKIPGGYLIRGVNRMKSNDELIDAVSSALSKSPLVDTFQFFYVRDPYPSDQDGPSTIDFENIWGEPVMVLFNKDISPERNGFVAALTTLITLFCVGIFSLEAFNDTPAIVSKIEAAYNDGNYDLDWLVPSVIPIFFYILATQLTHELAHQIFALKGKVSR